MRVEKPLPFDLVKPGVEWLRIHSRSREPLWFGPAPGSPPVNRFDDPEGKFHTCYLGTTLEACFAETFLRNPPVRLLSLEDLQVRSIATVRLERAVRLVSLHGPGLARVGVTAEVANGSSYPASQVLARSLWEHPGSPDGIAYHSRHDDSAVCIALFDRAHGPVQVVASGSLTSDA